jgi:hypothetical protein
MAQVVGHGLASPLPRSHVQRGGTSGMVEVAMTRCIQGEKCAP